MKHHFGDFLDRTGDYWTIIPNRERFAFMADAELVRKDEVKILTISKHHPKELWEQVFDCPNLEELTLHDPGKDQAQAIRSLKQLKRLRITFFRPVDIEFVGELCNVEELVLEYVSGFSDLSPLRNLSRLKSLHLENLRRVSNFDGLKGITTLRYLRIDGTVDWKQPIENFDFLEGLPNLEVLDFGFVINKTPYPAFLPILHLKKLQKVRAGMAMFDTREYAFIQAALPHVICGSFGGDAWTPCHSLNDAYVEFLGKGAGNVKLSSPKAQEKIEAFKRRYAEYKAESEQIIRNLGQ